MLSSPVMRDKAWMIFLPLVGLVMGYLYITSSNQLAAVTLYEVMAEGSLGLAPDSRAPGQTLSFNVEHPGVEHELLVDPTSRVIPGFAVDISFSLHGPTGETLIAERTEHFKPERRPNRRVYWEGKTVRFTPTVAGSHTIRVTPITLGIPGIHIRVADPLKRDGKRLAGY